MAGIYNRDNINYAGMLANMIANAKEGGNIRADYYKDLGNIWGNFVGDAGKGIARYMTWNDMNKQTATEDELDKKNAERQALIDAERQAAQDNLNDYISYSADIEDATSNMKGYESVPTSEEMWLARNPGSTHDDYVAYTEYMNSIYAPQPTTEVQPTADADIVLPESDIVLPESDIVLPEVEVKPEVEVNPKSDIFNQPYQRTYANANEAAFFTRYPSLTHEDYVKYVKAMHGLY